MAQISIVVLIKYLAANAIGFVKVTHKFESGMLFLLHHLIFADQKLPFFVASVLEGRDLRKELSVLYSFSELKTISIARQVLSILACLHAKGFTHGDIKPENILISSTGEVG